MRTVEKLDEAARALPSVDPGAPKVGVVLGSGLGSWAGDLARSQRIPYTDIPHMPSPGVQGHAGALWTGEVSGTSVICLQGRVHLYEGHDPERVVFGVRLLVRLGCRAALLTNAAGGLGLAQTPGALMLVTDHLNLTGRNPLVGPNDPALGPRFPDMTRAYDPDIASLAREAARQLGIDLGEGTYAAFLGPTYETPAEVRMARALGASAVGMSTVPEVIALRHMGVRVGAMSCITNLAAGISPNPLDHSEVEATAAKSRDRFGALLTGWVAGVGKVI